MKELILLAKISNLNFEDIRPYNNQEYHQIIEKLLEEDYFVNSVQYYFPDLDKEGIADRLRKVKTIDEFQSKQVCYLIEKIIDRSVDKISFTGRENLIKEESYLYLTNHRDIVLDSALLNFGLNELEFQTFEIAIGSNLLSVQWIKDLVRLNKSFIVKRDIPKQESLEASKTLSAYLHHTLKEKHQSIWIAQREGRAKDGFDKTNPGLLKMFGLSATEDTLTSLISMNIRPTSISYEYDPCDYLKIPELIAKSKGETYSKAPHEDFLHMSLGLKGYKGNISFHYGDSINEKLTAFKDIKNRNELLKNVSAVIDNQIYRNYKLWNSNYVAYDLLHSSTKYAEKYEENGKDKFVNYMNERMSDFAGDELARELFLKMYANPVLNAEAAAEEL